MNVYRACGIYATAESWPLPNRGVGGIAPEPTVAAPIPAHKEDQFVTALPAKSTSGGSKSEPGKKQLEVSSCTVHRKSEESGDKFARPSKQQIFFGFGDALDLMNIAYEHSMFVQSDVNNVRKDRFAMPLACSAAFRMEHASGITLAPPIVATSICVGRDEIQFLRNPLSVAATAVETVSKQGQRSMAALFQRASPSATDAVSFLGGPFLFVSPGGSVVPPTLSCFSDGLFLSALDAAGVPVSSAVSVVAVAPSLGSD